MKVLVVGSGGREHTLAWKIRQSPYVTWLGAAPGNGGTRSVAEPVDIPADDVEAIAKYAHDNEIELTVVGPEEPLARGLVDLFEGDKNYIFGPSSAASRIESSKSFAKDLMSSAGIPTAAYRVFTDAASALDYIEKHPVPLVVKASGLAAGKGVFICETREDARLAVRRCMEERIFGDSGDEVVIEEYLEGPEASLLAITDGTDYIMLPPSQDHKRIGEGDTGPNTGGMGAYAPADIVDDDLIRKCGGEIIEPTLKALRDSGTPYHGVLYAGLVLTAEGPKVLEFNCRFGDPETQAMLPLLGVDIIDLMLVAVTGKMGKMQKQLNLEPHQWRRISKTACAGSVVVASEGYPGAYEKNKEITGIPVEGEDLIAFHAGTSWRNGRLYTSGGRVLAITGLGDTLKAALDKAYKAIEGLNFEGKVFRRDIGWRALKEG